MLKKATSFLLILCMLILPAAVFASETGECEFLLSGEKTDALNIVKDGDVYMISEQSIKNIGASVYKYANKRTFFANGMSVITENGSSTAYINGVASALPKAVYVRDGELFVPVDNVLKGLGYRVKYSKDGKTCDIYVASEIENVLNRAEMIDGMYVSDELLTNTSFEEDFTLKGGWSGRNNATALQTDDFTVDGEYAGLVTDRPTGWGAISQDISSVLNEYGKGKYRLRGFLRTKDEPCDMRIKINITNSASQKYDFEDIKEVNNDGWTEFDYISDVQWDLSPSNAAFYAEATANTGKSCEKQDFYIDKVSLTKLMTADEYLEITTKQVEQKEKETAREREQAENYSRLSEKYASDSFDVYYPSEDRQILKNPYKGLIIYPGTLTFSGDMSSGAGEIGSILYHRYAWCYVEPEEGVYNWDIFDKNIELCKKYGMQFGLGIGSTINYNSTTSYNQDTPEWVFEAGCKYTVEDMGNGCVLKIPDYDDPIFQEKMQNMIDAFAERYNYNETIAYVDMRNYGNWGEWHFYSLPINRELDAKRTNEQFFKYIDMFKDVKLPTLTFVAKPDVVKHALETFGAGIRGDGLVNPTIVDNHKNLNLVEGKAMAVGEWFEQYTTVYQPGGKYAYYESSLPILYERQITEGHISSMAFLNWDADKAYQLWKDMYDRMANLLGYWYKPVKLEHSKDITKGLFRMKVKNDGVAPLFAGYDKKAVVKLALADDNGKILDTVVLDGFDPLYWSSGTYSDCAAEYEFKNTDGGTKLLLGVFTREQNEAPNVKLGIKADTINGWYDISSMTKSDTSNLAHNKLFKALEPYADEGYGFRRPEYSCDNNISTYWANKCVKGNYLEVDFGEEKNISSVTLTGAESIKVNYSIQGLKGDKWSVISNGVSISSAGTKIKFRSTDAEKLRLVIEQDKDAVIKISELKVN